MTSFWKRLFGTGDPPAAAPIQFSAANDDLLADVSAQVRRDVASGFYPPDEILQSAIEMFGDELPAPVLEQHARQALNEALAAHAAEQASWPEITDCDRLDEAFASLESGGIVMRQHFSCCSNCGSYEIWDEVKAFEEAGHRVYGYGFYHVQDTDHAVDYGSLHLNYGACEEGEEPAIATGRAIVAELQRHGLETDWDESWSKRIGVFLDWKRRRASQA